MIDKARINSVRYKIDVAFQGEKSRLAGSSAETISKADHAEVHAFLADVERLVAENQRLRVERDTLFADLSDSEGLEHAAWRVRDERALSPQQATALAAYDRECEAARA